MVGPMCLRDATCLRHACLREVSALAQMSSLRHMSSPDLSCLRDATCLRHTCLWEVSALAHARVFVRPRVFAGPAFAKRLCLPMRLRCSRCLPPYGFTAGSALAREALSGSVFGRPRDFTLISVFA